MLKFIWTVSQQTEEFVVRLLPFVLLFSTHFTRRHLGKSRDITLLRDIREMKFLPSLNAIGSALKGAKNGESRSEA